MSLENTPVPLAGPSSSSIELTTPEFAHSASQHYTYRSPSRESRRSNQTSGNGPKQQTRNSNSSNSNNNNSRNNRNNSIRRDRSSAGSRMSSAEVHRQDTAKAISEHPESTPSASTPYSKGSRNTKGKDRLGANAQSSESRSTAGVSAPRQPSRNNSAGSSKDGHGRRQRHKSKQAQHQGEEGTRHENQQDDKMNAGSDNAEKPKRRRNRNHKSDRKGDKGGTHGNRAKVGGGRMFDGTLTTEQNVSEDERKNDNSHTHAHAHTHVSSDDLCSTLSKRLSNSTYECMICCDKVRPRHAIWQCDHCWAIFHIGCVKKWAKSCSGGDSGDIGGRWRCPGCQYARAAAPSHYVCFCGATRDPEPIRGNVPHSCGKICEKCRGPHCPHPCPLPCHPGPCPPCTALAPEQSCFCGRLTYRPRCGADFDPVQGIKSCGEVCSEILGCGKHMCTEPCHPGLCPPCPHEEEQMCYCGGHTRTAKCGTGRPMPTFVQGKAGCSADDANDGDPSSPSVLTNDADQQQQALQPQPAIGFYSCGETCGELLNCGVHKCTKPCHAHPDPALGHGECPFDPAVVITCHCGAYLASDLGHPRAKCTDPVPSCGERCGHKLPGCSHTCKETCHAGPCPPCTVKVKTTCRCGSKTFQVECHRARSDSSEQPRCQRVCSKSRACRRHQCAVRCCPSDHLDIDGVVIPSEDLEPGVTDPHQCTLICGKLLRCKIHRCTQDCHRGPCPPCLHASFDELSCPCGRTRLMPPIPCGTTLPPCRYPCQRTRACGHVSLTSHECHPDDVPCPPCPVLVTTRCMCGGKELRSIPCYRSSAASCGNICNRLLPCGGHRCQRSCHRPDEPCLRGQPCRQACGKPRKTCGHPCALPCHSPAMCDESNPCEAMIAVACECGRRSVRELCGAGSANPQRGARKLACDEVCKIAQRNRRLALALNLTDRAEAPLEGLVKATYADDLLQFARANLSWVRVIESLTAEFIGDSQKPVMRFAPMKRAFRSFLHALAPFYGCVSRSIDREPLRSVYWERTVHATIPSIVLSSAIRYTNPPQIICSDRVNASEDSDFDDSASHIFDNVAASTNAAADRLRRKLDYLSLSDLRHGLTLDELETEIRKLLPYAPFTIKWKDEDLVEVYCTDIEAKNENLMKWETMLKHKLPHLGLVGSVVGVKVDSSPTQLPPIPPSLSSSSSSTSPQLNASAFQFGPFAPGSSTIAGKSSMHCRTHSSTSVASSVMSAAKRIFYQGDEGDDVDVPEDWESLNIQDDSTDAATDNDAGSVTL